MMQSKHCGKALGLVLLLGLCSPVVQAETSLNAGATQAMLQDLSFTNDAHQTKITVRANQAFDYSSYYPNPRLFILDLPGAQSKFEKNFVDFKTAQVDFASISQLGEGLRPMVRIEFNLAGAIHYSLKPEGSKLSLTFRSMNLEPPANDLQKARLAHPDPQLNDAAARPNVQPREVALREDDEQIQLVLPTASKPRINHFELAAPHRLVIDVNDSVYEVSKQAMKVDSDLIRRVRFGFGDSQDGKLVRCVFDLSRQTAYTVQAADSGVVVRFQKQNAIAKKVSKPADPQTPQLAETRIKVPDQVPVVPESHGTVAASGVVVDSRLMKPVLISESQKFVMPAPQAAPRNLALLENRVSAVELDPKEKQANTRLLAGYLDQKVVMPAPQAAPRNLALLETQVSAVELEPKDKQTDTRLLTGKPPMQEPLPPVELNPVTKPSDSRPEPVATAVSVTASKLERATEKPAVPVAAETKSLQPAALLKPAAEPVTQIAAFLQNPLPPASASKPAAAGQPLPAAPLPPAAPLLPAPRAVSAQETATQIISAAPVTQAQRYTGEPISLELKDADIKDFFRLIGEISGLNIVLDPDIKGSLTIFLNDVPWDQALDVVLKNNSLGKQLDGNVLRIAGNATLEAEEAQRKRLSDARVLAAELQTETRILSYAKAAELSTVLKKVLSPRGDIIVDIRTNAMIISDIPGKFPAIDALIKQLDRKIKQVEIEARVIAATRDFFRDVGIQWGLIGLSGNKTVAGALPGNPFSTTPPPPITMTGTGSAPNSIPLNVNLGATAPTGALSFFLAGNNFLLDSIISAAERRGNAKLLSKPKIITQDNIEGFVQQGVKIPVQTTINNTVSVQFFDFSLKLTVTPQITDEGTIILQVDVENSTPDFSRQVGGVPTVNTQQTKTTVLALNGGTVVIGGVMVDSEQINVRQVPGFGSLPLVGNLFKNRSVTKQTQELIFFLSPKIL
jgi:type IV pilus secretin PilQ/predicted competence protein